MAQINGVYLGKTRDGYPVYDREHTHIHYECGINKKLLNVALSYMYANGAKFKKKEIHFRDEIGYNNCIPVTSSDEVVYVYRKGRMGTTPMVKGRLPEACKSMVVIIRKDKDYPNCYRLVTSFVGVDSVKEPWDVTIRTEEERRVSEQFWSTHALVYNPDLIDWERTKLGES